MFFLFPWQSHHHAFQSALGSRLYYLIVQKLQKHLSNNNNHAITIGSRDDSSGRQHCGDEFHVTEGKKEGELYHFFAVAAWRSGNTECSQYRSVGGPSAASSQVIDRYI
jgi:hypothetical protein